MEKLSTDKKTLKKFGFVMGVAFSVITVIILLRHRHTILPAAVISTVFFIAAAFTPAVLKPVYIFWMRLAFVLGWINTRLILLALFYLMFTPLGICMRIFRVDLLGRKRDRDARSYWLKKDKKVFSQNDFERQF